MTADKKIPEQIPLGQVSPAHIALLRTQFRYAQTASQRRAAWRELRRLGVDPMGKTVPSA